MASLEDTLDLTFNAPHLNDLNNLTLVGKLITQKHIHYRAISSILSQSWNLGPNLVIHQLDQNSITCTFTTLADRNRILEAGPWAIKGALLNLKQWSPPVPYSEIDFAWCPFWVQIHHIPPNRMNEENAICIGNFTGNFIRLEDDPQLHRARKFMRVRVMVDTRRPLKSSSFITKENGTKLWLQFKYEKLSNFCYTCDKLDHSAPTCPDAGQ